MTVVLTRRDLQFEEIIGCTLNIPRRKVESGKLYFLTVDVLI